MTGLGGPPTGSCQLGGMRLGGPRREDQVLAHLHEHGRLHRPARDIAGPSDYDYLLERGQPGRCACSQPGSRHPTYSASTKKSTLPMSQ